MDIISCMHCKIVSVYLDDCPRGKREPIERVKRRDTITCHNKLRQRKV